MGRIEVDPVTLEVLRNSLLTVTKEMDFIIGRTSRATLWQESGDYSTAILTGNGDMVAQGPHGIPVHLGTMPLSVQHALNKIGKGALEPGDIIWNNDPYSGSNHVPDVLLVKPIFYEEQLVAISAVRGHWIDIGGSAPGSYSTANRDIYAEGFRLPPTKLFRRGTLNQDLFEAILANVRIPEDRRGDFEAQLAGLLFGERRVLALCQKYGSETFLHCLDKILDHSEELVRAEIRKMSKGCFSASDLLDGDEIDKRPIKIHVTVEIKGDEIEIDFTGSDGQATGGINAPYAVTCTAVYYTVKALTDPEIPANSGAWRPIKIYAPEGTIVNPRFPAPVVQGNHETGSRIVDVLFQAFAQALPDRAIAGVTGSASAFVIGGGDSGEERGLKPYLLIQIVDGGRGACLGGDGINATRCGVINAKNQPVEVIETRTPIFVEQQELVSDSGGPGRWRGGCSIKGSYRLTHGTAILTTLSDRVTTGPYGLFGGKEGNKCALDLRHGNRDVALFSKYTGVMEQGDVFHFQAAGGGGYGNPLQRNPQQVLNDYLNGYISLDGAEREYGVKIDPQTFALSYTEKRDRAQSV